MAKRLPHEWFWAGLGTRGADGRDRLQEALRRVRERSDPASNKALLHRIAEEFRDEIASAARKHNVSESLITAVIAVESAGRTGVRSHAGAEGLMQLIPATAQRFGVRDSFDPAQNVDGGAAYLSWLLETFGGDLVLALAGYNAGEGAVKKHDGVPPYAETRDYVVKVIRALADAERLCPKPDSGRGGSCSWPSRVV